MKKLLILPILFFILGTQQSYSGHVPPAPEGVDCVQPSIDGCEWFSNNIITIDDDPADSISGSGYVTVPVVVKDLADCVSHDDDQCAAGINEGESCTPDDDDNASCPIVGCIGPDCTTNKLAWEVEVFDPQSSHPDPNPCAETGGKFDFQCSQDIQSIPPGCSLEPGAPYSTDTLVGIKCPVDFNTSVEYCNPFIDDDDFSFIGPGFEVQLNGKHLYNPASGGRKMGGNDTNNSVNQTGTAHCLFIRR